MDIVAHGLWAGVGVAVASRRWPIKRRTAAAIVALAMAPDLAHLLPLIGAALFGNGGWAALATYATALPGSEPAMPPLVALLSHHLHCMLHSAVIAALVTLACWAWTRSLWLPLLGWWSHIAIDVVTHSKDFYPAPIFYPFTQWGFDGLAWNTPWFLIANHTAIALAIAWLLWRRWSASRGRR
jgi:LexA-binding, inner membrane-associated putative hydrolase